ncbi:hypothetical protein BsIDN1_18630 [Bacillus safensis]|uniref:Uncharacterized protein n=1 Tax=Bacillus safensis TaxID=561879 RepID=A0A5S9M5Z3_BACIA|nr:hypothetical protein BsIDN1_18630 [Bacillus safensis]
MKPHKGVIELNGRTLQDDQEAYRSQFTFIPETPVLYEELTLKRAFRADSDGLRSIKGTIRRTPAIIAERISNGETAEMVPCSFFKRNEAEGHDYVCIPCGTRAVYHR